MKGPQSLYLSVLAHNRLSGYVERSLGGQGTLNGLIGFIEERGMALLNYANVVADDHAANRHFIDLTLLQQHELRRPLTTYMQTWDAFADALPWFEENPVAAHLAGMHPLLEFPSLWDASFTIRDRPRHRLEAQATGLGATIEAIREPYVGPTSMNAGRDTRWTVARPIFGRDRIDFVTADRQAPISVYLDTSTHQHFYRAFGNSFFARLEHALITMLEDPEATLDIEHAALFLEFGPDAVDLDELTRAAREIASTYAERDMPPTTAGRSESVVAAHAKQMGYTSLDDATLLQRGLALLYLRQRDIERTIGYDTWHMTPDVSEETLATLHLGNRLGLIDGSDLRLLPYRITTALLEQFGITEIAPTRMNAFRFMAGSGINNVSQGHLDRFSNAVDFHMWELYTLYARQCLGIAADEALRTSHQTLATLAEGDLFPRVGAIEAFTGSRVGKTADGRWQLKRGRKELVTLDHAAFLQVGETLRRLVPLRDPVTVAGDSDSSCEEPRKDSAPAPYSYPVSPDIIDTALQSLTVHGEASAHRALDTELRKMTPQPQTSRVASRRTRAPA